MFPVLEVTRLIMNLYRADRCMGNSPEANKDASQKPNKHMQQRPVWS